MDQQMVAAYTAGVIDGEGCISLARPGTSGSLTHQLSVRVGSTDLMVLEFLKEKWGGNIWDHRLASNGQKRSWQWQVQTIKAEKLLEAIQPYLIIKYDRCALALKHRRLQAARGSTHYTKDERKALDEIVTQMSELNRRGTE